jgi:hypothetical protein
MVPPICSQGTKNRSRGGCGDFDKLVTRACCVPVSLMGRWVLSVEIDAVNAGPQLSRCCRLVPARHARPQHIHGLNGAGEWGGKFAADLRMVSVTCGSEIRPNIGRSNQAEGLLLVRSVRVRLGTAQELPVIGRALVAERYER